MSKVKSDLNGIQKFLRKTCETGILLTGKGKILFFYTQRYLQEKERYGTKDVRKLQHELFGFLFGDCRPSG